MEKDKKVVEEVKLTAEEEAKLAETEKAPARDERFTPSYDLAKQYKVRGVIVKIITYTFLTLFALFMLLPFWFMVSMSLKTPLAYEAEQLSGLRLFTENPSFVNFKIIFGVKVDNPELYMNSTLAALIGDGKQINFVPFFMNTIIVAVISTVFTVITTILAAFAFARLDFKFKNALFALLLATMMVPGEMMLITNIQTATAIGWKDTFAALIFVHGVSVFYIFYLRQTFQQIPNELYLAAKVDGYGEFRYLWRVMLPIGMPTVVTIIILNVMGSWNAYIWPQLIASSNNAKLEQWGIIHDMRLVSNGLMSTFTTTFGSYDTLRVTGAFVISLPLLIVFMLFRKYIMSGVSRSGIKG